MYVYVNEDNKIIAHPPTVLFTYLVWCLPSFLCSKVDIPAPGMVNGQKFDVDIHMNTVMSNHNHGIPLPHTSKSVMNTNGVFDYKIPCYNKHIMTKTVLG